MANREIIENESRKWVSKKIITSDQQKEILSLYTAKPQSEGKKSKKGINITSILSGMAAVLFSVGIILFYAANWKVMPTVIKVIHIYLLIILFYGLSFYVLFVKGTRLKLGRMFLVMGMISFGAGIMLIAQIFHISSHPANGILLWAAGALAISVVVKEKWGYYLSLLLFFIWNQWEYSTFGNPNYPFLLVPAIYGYLFYKGRQEVALFLPFILAVTYFYQVNTHLIGMLGHKLDVSGAVIFAITHLPLGITLTAISRLTRENCTLRYLNKLIYVLGAVFMIVPFSVLSWPGEYRLLNPVLNIDLIAITAEAALFIILGSGLTYMLFKRKESVIMLVETILFSVLFMALPMGHTPTRMIFTHMAMLLFMSSFIYLSYSKNQNRSADKRMAFFIFIYFMALKFFGFMGIGIADQDFRAAYFLGFVVFLTVCFLINQLITLLLNRREIEYTSGIIDSVSAFLLFFNIYGLTFELEKQKSIFSADRIVLIMLFLFITISLGLYTLLWKKIASRTALILSAVVFFTSIAVLFITGPETGWVFYSVIFNLLLFIITGILIFFSVKIHSRKLLNLAIAGFIIHIITRYFDLFWNLLSGSFLFLATGIVLFAGAWSIERYRRRFLKKIENME